jgi:hypothetical protein
MAIVHRNVSVHDGYAQKSLHDRHINVLLRDIIMSLFVASLYRIKYHVKESSCY